MTQSWIQTLSGNPFVYQVGDGSEAPVVGQPAGHELAQRVVERAADLAVHDPPGGHGIGARRCAVGRGFDVHAAEQLGLLGVEDRVVERLVRLDLTLVAGEVDTVLLDRHRRRRPAPRRAVPRPQRLL